jgi:hypothetical protein
VAAPQLLDAGDRAVLGAQVQAALPALPEDARQPWARVVDPR